METFSYYRYISDRMFLKTSSVMLPGSQIWSTLELMINFYTIYVALMALEAWDQLNVELNEYIKVIKELPDLSLPVK